MKINSLPVQTEPPVNSLTVGVAVLAKNLDTIDQAGQSLIQMMEQSVQPELGKNIDYKV
jgi:hypothetical protein